VTGITFEPTEHGALATVAAVVPVLAMAAAEGARQQVQVQYGQAADEAVARKLEVAEGVLQERAAVATRAAVASAAEGGHAALIMTMTMPASASEEHVRAALEEALPGELGAMTHGAGACLLFAC
jgi:hypothetical protein